MFSFTRGDIKMPNSNNSQEACKCAHLHNPTPERITNDAAKEWCEDIQKELEKGHGFIPFIGAGFSVPSGAPGIVQLLPYLKRCIASALGVETERGVETEKMRPWNPRTDQWPPFSNTHSDDGDHWLTVVRNSFDKRRQQSLDPELPVFQEAIGAMAEWRTALSFLARVARYRDSAGPISSGLLALDAPHQEVIDAGLREIMKGREPNLGHRMLAVLGVTLRLDIVLTTNFDDLLERAFEAARNPLTVFELHLNSTLPPWSALSSQRSLVKLHGTRHSLRADYTLDALPSELDCKTFLEYLMTAGERTKYLERIKGRAAPNLPFQNHLLMLGFSGRERRTRALIEYAWEHLSEDFKVYWLCHSKRDVEHVRNVTHEFHETNKKNIPNWQGSRILRFPYLGLLFLQLWQTLRHGLPTNGIIFPSASRLAEPPLPRSQGPTDEAKKQGDNLRDQILKRLSELSNSGLCRMVVVTSPENVKGVTSVCADVYQIREDDHDLCLWIDMNEISSTDDLFDKLLDAAYYRLGIEKWKPVYVLDDPIEKAKELHKLIKSSSSPWVIFINARDTPGANTSEDIPDNFDEQPNGWFDIPDNNESDCPSAGLVSFLTELGCPHLSPAVSVVLLCRQSNEAPPIVKELQKTGHCLETLSLPSSAVALSQGKPVRSSIEWTNNDPKRQRFLHALVLMQRPRYLATIWSDAAFTAAGGGDSKEPARWLTDLEERGLVRYKPGGFIWLHSPTRNELRSILGDQIKRSEFLLKEPEESKIKLQKCFEGWDCESEVEIIHVQLCHWYRRVFDASNAHSAIFEALYHACMSAESSLKALRIEEARDKIELASSLLRTHGFLLQVQADSRGSCRYLEYVSGALCERLEKALAPIAEVAPATSPPVARTLQYGDGHYPVPSLRADMPLHKQAIAAIQLLRIRCTEVMRSIAREIGEDGWAYKRQRDLRALLAGKQPAHADNGKAKDLYDALLTRHDEPAFLIDPVIEWLRWWRWNGMLGLASRSYSEALNALRNALFTLSRPKDLSSHIEQGVQLPELEVNQLLQYFPCVIDFCKQMKETVYSRPVRDWQQLRLEVLRIIEQIIAVRLDQCSVAKRGGTFWGNGLIKPLGSLIDLALELVEQVVSHDHSSNAMAVAMWCRTRLLMHQSICTCLATSSGEGDWHLAMRLLADAEACSNYHDPRRQGTDRAAIELYRAEVRLLGADHTLVCESAAFPIMERWPISAIVNPSIRSGSFAQLRHQVPSASQRHPVIWYASGQDFRQRSFPSGPLKVEAAKNLRKVQVSVQVALRFLARAEQDLLSHRRHLWWTTRYASRKLSAIAMSVWATILENGTPIPFLGLEAAPRGTLTAADTLLADSLRMIRIDAYRLATIVEGYAACATALHYRLMLDNGTPRLVDRQRHMREQLHDAIDSLRKILKRRQEWKSHPAHKGQSEISGNMDEMAQTYVQNVLNGCELVEHALRHPLESQSVELPMLVC